MSTETSEKVSSESQHWYDLLTGEPRYTIIGSNGKERPTTLRDARKHGYVPSVTTILKECAKPALVSWLQKQVLLAALTLPREMGETEESFAGRVMEDSKQQARKAAEKGTAIHAAIEKFLGGGEKDIEYAPQIDATMKVLTAHGVTSVPQTEKSFACSDGYGGKVDLYTADGWVVDFKTKDTWNDKVKSYDEHKMQLVAYSKGLGIPNAKHLNIFIYTGHPVQAIGCEVTEEEKPRCWDMFKCLLRFWQYKNNFFPLSLTKNKK